MFISIHSIHEILLYKTTDCRNQDSYPFLRIPIPFSPRKPARHDYEYKHNGMCNVFLACEPLTRKRMVKFTERKTKRDWVYFLEEIEVQHENADEITLVMD